jgi:hypothetical protein
LDTTRQELDSAIEAVQSSDSPAATTAWCKVKTWITSALDIGAFAAATATKVRELVDQIGKLWW